MVLTPRSFSGRSFSGLLVAVSCLLAPQVGAAAGSGTGAFTLPEQGEVLRYQRVLGELEHPDPGPEVILRADGRLQVRRPVYMKQAGTWQTRLDAAQMRALLEGVVASGLVDAELDELRARRAGIERQRAEAAERAGTPRQVYAVGDPDRSVLTLSLASYTPPGELGAAAVGPLTRSWQWWDLYGDAGRFPEIPELAAFHRLELRMIEFIDAQTLERVPAEEVTP